MTCTLKNRTIVMNAGATKDYGKNYTMFDGDTLQTSIWHVSSSIARIDDQSMSPDATTVTVTALSPGRFILVNTVSTVNGRTYVETFEMMVQHVPGAVAQQSGSPPAVNSAWKSEALAIVTQNVIPAVGTNPTGEVMLSVQGGIYTSNLTPGLTRSGQLLTWNASIAGFDIDPGDIVIANYPIEAP